jgi:hypothetical protein
MLSAPETTDRSLKMTAELTDHAQKKESTGEK